MAPRNPPRVPRRPRTFNQNNAGNQDNEGNPADTGNQPTAGDLFAEILNVVQNHNGNNNNNSTRVVEQFRHYRPPTFNGRDGPTAVEEWLRALERIFRLIACTDEQRVACAAFQLTDDADHWWEGYWRNRTEEERDALSWDEFKEVVMEKYFPRSYRDKKETKFLNFKQRGLTVTEYEREFNQLCRFAPHLVDTDLKKALRFRRGLRSQLSGILSAQGDLEYSVMVRRAHEVEAGLAGDDDDRKPAVVSEKRKFDGTKPSKMGNQNKQIRTDGNSRPSAPNNKPTCPKCNRNHYGECLAGQGKYFII